MAAERSPTRCARSWRTAAPRPAATRRPTSRSPRVDQPTLDRVLADVGAGRARHGGRRVSPDAAAGGDALPRAGRPRRRRRSTSQAERFSLRGEIDERCAGARLGARWPSTTPCCAPPSPGAGSSARCRWCCTRWSVHVERTWTGAGWAADEVEAPHRRGGARPTGRAASRRAARRCRAWRWRARRERRVGAAVELRTTCCSTAGRCRGCWKTWASCTAPSPRARRRALVARRPFRDHVALLEARGPRRRGGVLAPRAGRLRGAPARSRPRAARAAPRPRAFGEARAHALARRGGALARAGRRRPGSPPPRSSRARWALLLARYTGESDVAFGNVVSGRPPELEGAGEMVGMLINTLPVRAPRSRRTPRRARGCATCRRARPRRASTTTRRWWRCAAGPAMEAGRELFETLFVYENYPVPTAPARRADGGRREADAEGAGMHGRRRASRASAPTTRSRWPWRRAPVAPSCGSRTTPSASTPGTMRRMLRRTILRAGRRARRRRRARRSARWRCCGRGERGGRPTLSAGPPLRPTPAPLHRLFEARVARVAGRVGAALRRGDGHVRGAERARQPPRAPPPRAGRGARSSHRAVSLERSPELVAALLGIFKAGGVFLPVDPAYPAERRRCMLEDAARRGSSSPPPHRRRPARGGARRWSRWMRSRSRSRPRTTENPAVEVDVENAGVRDLHLGLHGPAQGRRRAAPRHRQPGGGAARAARGPRRVACPPVRLVLLRRGGGRPAARAPLRRHAGAPRGRPAARVRAGALPRATRA